MKAKELTFEQLLNIPRAKKLIEALEYVIPEANDGNTDKQEIAESYAEELMKEYGYPYLAIHKEW
jgi:translation initiation factor 2 alpha subunit (eIF-2alpha)